LKTLYEIAPKFVEADPDLKALVDMISTPEMTQNDKGEKVPTGKRELIADAIDGNITLDEFKANPTAMLKLSLTKTTPEAFFAKIQESLNQLQYPIYLWPADLKAKLKATGEESFQALSQIQVLSPDQRRAELVLQFLEQTNVGKYQQEIVDHAGSAGDSYVGWAVGHVVGALFWDKSESWNDHFQKTRPEDHRKERTEAIEALKKAMRENPTLLKVEDALSFLENNGQASQAKVLKDDCDIDQWIRNANIKDDITRYKDLDRIGDEYRAGKVKNFWDFQIIPAPRLGEGGFWNRFTTASAWTWGKSPDLPITLAIDNYLAQNIPNTYLLDNQGKTEVLGGQLSEAEKKAYDELLEKTAKGEKTELKTAEDLLSKAALTPQGQKALLDRYNVALVMGQNKKVYEEASALEFMKALKTEQIEEISKIFGAAAGGVYKTDMLEQKLDTLSLPSKDSSELKTYLSRVKVVLPPDETGGINTLFQEAQLGDNEKRAREILNKVGPTQEEKDEFKKLVEGSKLSTINQTWLMYALEHQAENRIAEAAHKEFFQILGNPTKDQMTGEFDPKSVGNLHNSIRTTADRAVGVAVMGSPTLIGGGIGYSLSKTPMWFERTVKLENGTMGKTKLVPTPLVIGTLAGAVGYGTAEPENRLRNGAIGFAAGTTIAYGLSRFVKGRGASPWWGAAALGLAGSVYTAGTWSGGVGSMGWEIMQTPYRPWSDFSMNDSFAEGLNLYVDFSVGTKGMGAVLDGLKVVGAMELVQRASRFVGASPLGARKAVGVALGAGMGGLQGWDMTPAGADGTTKIRNIGIGATLGGLFSYGLYLNKLRTFTAAGALGGGYIGYNAVDPEDMGNTKKRLQYAMIGAAAGGGLVYLMGRGAAKYFKASDEMMIKNAGSAPKGSWVSPWAEQQYTKTMESLTNMEAMVAANAKNAEKVNELRTAAETARLAGDWKKYNGLLEDLSVLEGNPRLLELRRLAMAYEKLGKAGAYPHYQANVLSQAQQVIGAGGVENLATGNVLILRGAQELAIMESGGLANSRIAKLLLTGAVADKVDSKIRPPTPLIPEFSKDFEGKPKADPVPQDGAAGGF